MDDYLLLAKSLANSLAIAGEPINDIELQEYVLNGLVETSNTSSLLSIFMGKSRLMSFMTIFCRKTFSFDIFNLLPLKVCIFILRQINKHKVTTPRDVVGTMEVGIMVVGKGVADFNKITIRLTLNHHVIHFPNCLLLCYLDHHQKRMWETKLIFLLLLTPMWNVRYVINRATIKECVIASLIMPIQSNSLIQHLKFQWLELVEKLSPQHGV